MLGTCSLLPRCDASCRSHVGAFVIAGSLCWFGLASGYAFLKGCRIGASFDLPEIKPFVMERLSCRSHAGYGSNACVFAGKLLKRDGIPMVTKNNLLQCGPVCVLFRFARWDCEWWALYRPMALQDDALLALGTKFFALLSFIGARVGCGGPRGVSETRRYVF